MKTSIKIITCVVALGAIAACGGSNDGTNKMDDTTMQTPTSPSTPPDTRDAGQILFAGETLTARNATATIRQDHIAGKTELLDPVGLSIRRTKDGEYVVTMDGHEHTFPRSQRTETGADGPNDAEALDMGFQVYGYTRRDFHENLDAGHSRDWPLTIWSISRDEEHVSGPDPELRAFGTFGNPTTDFNHMTDMTATYTGGWSWLHIYAAEFEPDNFDWDEDRVGIYSDDLEFTANFSDGTISGRITGYREWEDDHQNEKPWDVTLTMPETRFGTDAFQGDFTVSGDTMRTAAADFDASFFGSDATGFAGTVTISGTVHDDGPVVGIGHFVVDKSE